VVWETQLSGSDEEALQDAMLQRLAEKEPGYYGKPALPRPGALAKGTAPGTVSLSCSCSQAFLVVSFSSVAPSQLLCH
jgi:hypothetical protein